MISFNIEKDAVYFVVTSTLGGRDSLKPIAALVFGPGGGGGTLPGIPLVGVCRPVPQILTRFQTKKFNFPHMFSD